ncbi:hypothetical protein F4802DRAFT_591114 [Xylaria palmicola]|nr:hypothetical protein F4802DRAFT_591114 [Xylaria palmicola]
MPFRSSIMSVWRPLGAESLRTSAYGHRRRPSDTRYNIAQRRTNAIAQLTVAIESYVYTVQQYSISPSVQEASHTQQLAVDLTQDRFSCAGCHEEVKSNTDPSVFEYCGCVCCSTCTRPSARAVCNVSNHKGLYGEQNMRRLFGLFEKCAICWMELNNPVWMRACGHVFCKKCFETGWTGSRGQCFTCRSLCCGVWQHCKVTSHHAGQIIRNDFGVLVPY